MIPQKTLAELIQEKLYLPPENERGWHVVKCSVCNDYQERGGFRFDGECSSYFCWNCQSRFKYEEGSGRFSKNCRDVLSDFGITREDLQSVAASTFFHKPEKQDTEISLKTLTKVNLHTPEVPWPDKTLRLGSGDHRELQVPLIEYLKGRRIDYREVDLRFSLEPSFLRRIIIPFYRDGKLIYWQARAIDGDAKRRYLNCALSKEAVIYGYDQLSGYDETPLFITEGVFDAIPLNGVCLLGSKLNEAKLEILRRSRRRKIFVFDKDSNGGELGKVVIENGWELTHVDTRADDVNDSLVKYGLPYTVYSLLKNARTSTTQVEKKFSTLNMQLELMKTKLRKANYA